MNLNTKYRKIRQIDFDGNETVQNILKQYDISKQKSNKVFYGKAIEIKIIDAFLEKNNIAFSDFIHLLLFRDGAITDEMAIATLHTFKKMKDVFIKDVEFTFEYKKNFTNSIEAYKESERGYKPLKIRTVMLLQIDNYWPNKGFFNFQQYLKALMNDFGLYPESLYKEIKKDSETVQDRSKLKKKELTEDKSTLYSASFTVSKFEKDNIITPFNSWLQKKGLNISKVVRHEMLQLGLTDYESASLDKSEIKKIENLTYSKNYKYKSVKEIEGLINKMERDTVVVLIPDSEELKETLKGKMGTFVKYVLNKYKIYPKFGEEPYNKSFKVFQSKTRLNGLEEYLKSIKKSQEN